jgi:hypothetical protein
MDVPPGGIRHVSVVRLSHTVGIAGEEAGMHFRVAVEIVGLRHAYDEREARALRARSEEAADAAEAP